MNDAEADATPEVVTPAPRSTPSVIRRRRRPSRWPRALAAVLIALLLLITAGGVFADLEARAVQAAVISDLQAGSAKLEAGKSALSNAGRGQPSNDVATAEADFNAALVHFSRARRIIDRSSLLDVGMSLPVAASYLRPQVQTVDGISDMGSAVARAGLDTIPLETALLSGSGGANESAGQRLLGVLKSSQPAIQRVEADLQVAQNAAYRINLRYVPASQRGTLESAKASIATGLGSIRELQASTPALIEILGGNGARTYLVEQMNPAELRAGGGFIGSFALVHVDQGKFGIVKSGGIADADYPRQNIGGQCINANYNFTPCAGHKYVSPPSVMKEFLGAKSWVLGDSNFWPDFPTNASTAQSFAESELHMKPDGVIAIDPEFIAALLKVTGPIQVPGFDFTAKSDTFVDDLFKYENGRYSGAATVRKQMFPALAGPLIDKITTLPSSAWPALTEALNSVAKSHDLQMYFSNGQAEELMNRYRWSGALQTAGDNEFAMEVESNFGGTKANQFVQRSFQVNLTATGTTLHHKVTVTVKDSMPDGLYEGHTFYRVYARLYIPKNANNAKAESVFDDRQPTDEHPQGLSVLDGWQQANVDPRQGYGTAQMVFEYDTPLPAGWKNETIYWQKQAGTGADNFSVTLGVNGTTVTRTTTLNQDLVITIGADGSLSVAPAAPPSASLPGLRI